MKSFNIIDPSYEDVDQCHEDTEGQNMLHQIGVMTKALDPKVTFVPWVTFNDVRKVSLNATFL